MRKTQMLVIGTLILAVSGMARAAVIDEADWTLRDRSKLPVNWVLNGNARLCLTLSPFAAAVEPEISLRLADNSYYEAGAVWHQLKGRLSSFTFIANVRVVFDSTSRRADACPADGFTLAFANATESAVGAYGEDLGIFNAGGTIPQFTAFEVNTWRGHGLGDRSICNGNNETFAFDIVGPGTSNLRRGASSPAEVGGDKVGQVNPPPGMKIVNGGWYRYQFNADGATNTLTAYVTGLEESNRQFQRVKVLEAQIGIPILNFEGRFGLTGGTGAAVMRIDVAYTRIEAPMVGPL